MHPASPTAAQTRIIISCTKLSAVEQAITAALHKAAVVAMILARLPRSAHRAIGIPMVA